MVLNPLPGLVATGATVAGLSLGLAVGTAAAVVAHAALAMEPRK